MPCVSSTRRSFAGLVWLPELSPAWGASEFVERVELHQRHGQGRDVRSYVRDGRKPTEDGYRQEEVGKGSYRETQTQDSVERGPGVFEHAPVEELKVEER